MFPESEALRFHESTVESMLSAQQLLFYFSDVLETCSFSPGKNWSQNDKFPKHALDWLVSCMGVSLNGGTPNLHPKMIIFSRKTPWRWFPGNACYLVVQAPESPTSHHTESPNTVAIRSAGQARWSTRNAIPLVGWIFVTFWLGFLLVENDGKFDEDFFSVGWNQHQRSSWSVSVKFLILWWDCVSSCMKHYDF